MYISSHFEGEIPEWTRELRFSAKITSLSGLPDHIEKLDFSHCRKLRFLPNKLPDGLKKLNLINCKALTSLPKLPDGLKKLNLINCKALTSLPKLPDSLKELYLIDCKGLRDTPALIEQLLELKARGVFVWWPAHIDRTSKASAIKRSLYGAYKEYYKSEKPQNSEEEMNHKIQNILDQATYQLFHRYLSEAAGARGGVNSINRDAELVAGCIKENPWSLLKLDDIAQGYLNACVNQPVAGFTEIAFITEILKQDDISSKLEVAKNLLIALNIRQEAVALKVVGKGVEVEFTNAMLQAVHKKLLREKKIATKWPGIPEGVAYALIIKNYLTKERVNVIYNKALENIKQYTPEYVANYMCERESADVWALIILGKEKYDELNKEYLNLQEKYKEDGDDEILEKIPLIKKECQEKILTESRKSVEDFLKRKNELKQIACSSTQETGNERNNITSWTEKTFLFSTQEIGNEKNNIISWTEMTSFLSTEDEGNEKNNITSWKPLHYFGRLDGAGITK